jgi:hypothetical protein
MNPLDAFMRAVSTLRNYHPRDYTHVKMRGDYYLALVKELSQNYIVDVHFKLLGFWIEVDENVPAELLVFHSPAIPGVARIPWHGEL